MNYLLSFIPLYVHSNDTFYGFAMCIAFVLFPATAIALVGWIKSKIEGKKDVPFISILILVLFSWLLAGYLFDN